MFQRDELERLRLQKEQLLSQCDVCRQRLLADWRRLRSSELWLQEGLGLARRHPLWIMTLATASGTLLARSLRRPRALARRIGQAGRAATVAFSLWKWLRKRNRPS